MWRWLGLLLALPLCGGCVASIPADSLLATEFAVESLQSVYLMDGTGEWATPVLYEPRASRDGRFYFFDRHEMGVFGRRWVARYDRVTQSSRCARCGAPCSGSDVVVKRPLTSPAGVATIAEAMTAPVRYPDPAVQILDESFAKYRVFNAAVERLASGFRWAEGPVWFGDGRYVLWSDIPNNRIMRWEEETGAVSVFRKPSNYANGNTRDRQGRLVTCEHDSRRVTRTEYDGTITVLMDRFEGKRLNSPNDVVVKADDSVWFTDPPFGVLGNYEGHTAPLELPTNVYRVDPRTGQATAVTGDVPRPNGLCFSPDESRLYVVVSGTVPREIRVFDVVAGGTALANGRLFIDAGAGIPDGMRCDTDGNLWCGWGGGEGLDGVAIYNPDARLIGRILLPERCANLCWGDLKRNRLFLAASQSLYSLYVNTQGVVGG